MITRGIFFEVGLVEWGKIELKQVYLTHKQMLAVQETNFETKNTPQFASLAWILLFTCVNI